MIEMFQHLSRYEGPPEGFLRTLLQMQVQVVEAFGGAILRVTDDGYVEAVAAQPPLVANATPPVWMATGAEMAGEVISAGRTLIRPLHSPDDLYGQAPQEHLVLVPLTGGKRSRGVAVFALGAHPKKSLAERVERLELIVALMSLHELRLGMLRRQNDLARLRVAMDVLSSTNAHSRFQAAVMSLCNEMATRWQSDRVSFGVLEGRYVKLKGMSGTEKFNRKMKLVQDIEAAMEECLDQDLEILAPADDKATYVSRAGAELARKHGPSNVICFPLRREGKPVAVVCVERASDRPFDLAELETMRLTVELNTARLMDLHDTDLWFGKRMGKASRKALAAVVGPKHTWMKVAAVAVMVFLLVMFFGKGQYTAEGDMTIETEVMQVVPAPFEGILDKVYAEVGQQVDADKTVLALLDTAELQEQLATARVERQQATKAEAEAMRDGKTVEAQIARQDILKAEAKIRLYENRIAQASVKSPISGTVIEGDLKRHLGRRVELGDTLFQVAPLGSMRAEVLIREDQIGDVRVGQEGELATLAQPDSHIRFVVERVDPMAEVVKQQNVFRVRVRLQDAPEGLMPGMTGVGRVHVEDRSYAYIWSRRLINWIRMKLWW